MSISIALMSRFPSEVCHNVCIVLRLQVIFSSSLWLSLSFIIVLPLHFHCLSLIHFICNEFHISQLMNLYLDCFITVLVLLRNLILKRFICLQLRTILHPESPLGFINNLDKIEIKTVDCSVTSPFENKIKVRRMLSSRGKNICALAVLSFIEIHSRLCSSLPWLLW